jgi:hypothetical protein
MGRHGNKRAPQRWWRAPAGASVPEEIAAFYVAQYAREQAERQRVDAMTPVQRQARTEEILARLRRRGSAFAEIPLNRDPRTWTPEADAALLAAWEAGTPASEIGRKLNVPHAAVLVRAHQIGAQWNSTNAPETEGSDPPNSSKPAF